MTDTAFFERQFHQYPEIGPPGVSYFRGDISAGRWVDCLLWRDEDGVLRGILNRYPQDIPPYEKRGNVNVMVAREWKRRGIATALVKEAINRWGVDFDAQNYTPEGLKLRRSFK